MLGTSVIIFSTTENEREAALVALLSSGGDPIQYMYYDTVDGAAAVTLDAEYNQELARCCVPAIV